MNEIEKIPQRFWIIVASQDKTEWGVQGDNTTARLLFDTKGHLMNVVHVLNVEDHTFDDAKRIMHKMCEAEDEINPPPKSRPGVFVLVAIVCIIMTLFVTKVVFDLGTRHHHVEQKAAPSASVIPTAFDTLPPSWKRE